MVSAFISGSVNKIKKLKPDLVIGFSDIQADLAAELIKEGLNVLIFNQRSLQEILETLEILGRLVDRADEAQVLVQNRVSAAMAGLPSAVQEQGVVTEKKSTAK